MIPPTIRGEVYQKVSERADGLGWLGLAPSSRSKYYDAWTRDPEIGGRLVRYVDPGQIRHFIKDALVKQYTRERRDDVRTVLSHFGVRAHEQEKHTRPLGCRLRDGRTFVWGRANNWKALLLALHERTFADSKTRPAGVLLMESARHFATEEKRAVVEDAARKLGLEKVIWRME